MVVSSPYRSRIKLKSSERKAFLSVSLFDPILPFFFLLVTITTPQKQTKKANRELAKPVQTSLFACVRVLLWRPCLLENSLLSQAGFKLVTPSCLHLPNAGIRNLCPCPKKSFKAAKYLHLLRKQRQPALSPRSVLSLYS